MEQNTLENQLKRTLILFVRESGIKLKLSPIGVATALMITHILPKNIVMKDMKDVHLLGEAIVLIASKTTEELRKVRDVVNVTYRMLHPSPHPPIEIDEKYKNHKEHVLNYEQIILRSVGFSLNFELPHKYLLNYLKSLGASAIFAQTCWTLLNDSFLNSKIALSDPSLVAISIIYFSLQIMINNNNSKNHITSNKGHKSEEIILQYFNEKRGII